VGLLRFPDVYCRLHALTKVDNLGLGLVLAGLSLREGSILVALKLLLIWMLVLLASTTACHLGARAARHLGVEAWRRP
jgi:multicomponent Na+:H+ antiporter subunit G